MIEKVEPTFFSSYPFFGLQLTNLCLSEDINTSQTDTLLYSSKCFASFDVMGYLFDNDITLKPFLVENGYLNFKIDASGHSNFDILKNNTESEENDSTALSLGDININNVEFKNFNAFYADETTYKTANLQNLNANLEFIYQKDQQYVNLDMQFNRLLFTTSDSMAIYVEAKTCDLKMTSKASDENLFNSDLKLVCQSMSAYMNGDTVLSNMKFDMHLPISINITENSYDLNQAHLIIKDEQEVSLSGNIKILKDNSISTDITYATNQLDLKKTIALIPKAYLEPIKGVSAKGSAQLSGQITGLVSDTSLPLVRLNIEYNEGEIQYPGYPRLRDVKLSVSTIVDMNKMQSSDIIINNSYVVIESSSISLKGSISNILENPVYDLHSEGNFNLSDFKPYIPKDQNTIISGFLNGHLNAKFSQSDLDKEAYHHIYLIADFNTRDFHAIYNDSIIVDLPRANFKLNLPSHARADKNLLFANIKINAPNLNVSMSTEIQVVTKNLELAFDINNSIKSASLPITTCHYKVADLFAIVDTLSFKAKNIDGKLNYTNTYSAKQEIALINSIFNSQEISVLTKDSILFDARNLYAKTKLKYDTSQTNEIDQWQPELAISFSDANYKLSEQLKGQILDVSCTITPEQMEIEKIDLTIADSDYKLNGALTNISKYLNNEGLLKGDFFLVSKSTNVYQLMEIFDGMGNQDSTLVAEEASSEDMPFMVPKGVEIRLNTSIDKTIINDNIIKNIKGGLTVKDGTLILDQMGFTSKAAHMQLTAMYRSDRKNHLFSGIDFHLLEIDIAELIALIPSVDSVLPMLKSFDGRGEFHLAGEAYLKSDYSVKQSTIRGAAAFQGQNLTLMDSETFDMIASELKFRKKTTNIIDSLSVEMTLFKDEIDLYPFLIVMDNYKAVISGRQTLDNRFKYHISVTETPLPIRLGLDITGTLDKLDYKLVPCKYKHLYNPKKQGALEERTLRLKKLISESLKENVKPIK